MKALQVRDAPTPLAILSGSLNEMLGLPDPEAAESLNALDAKSDIIEGSGVISTGQAQTILEVSPVTLPEDSIPYGYCHCGCGQKTDLAPNDNRGIGWIKGQPKKFIHPHQARKWKNYGSSGSTRNLTYQSWQSIIQRTRPDSSRAPYYYDRGIRVCDRWLSYDKFVEDMGTRPPETSIDRIDVNRGYEPENCRWATALEQANNKTDNVRIEVNGVSHTCAEWGRINGLKTPTICQRLKAGWSPQAAVTLPTGSRKI